MEPADITKLLKAHASGDPDALDKLMPLVYDEMRIMAHRQLFGERAGHTLNTTAMVHEAYLKLAGFDRVDWQNRSHFFGIASRVMRQILAGYAVKKKAKKRGGDQYSVTLGKSTLATEIDLDEVLSIHHALERLAGVDERQVRVVECRFFGGMTIDEISEALGISVRTVSRDWEMARAWLNRELSHESLVMRSDHKLNND